MLAGFSFVSRPGVTARNSQNLLPRQNTNRCQAVTLFRKIPVLKKNAFIKLIFFIFASNFIL